MEITKKQNVLTTDLPKVKNQEFIFDLLHKLSQTKIDFIDTFTDQALCKELFRLRYPLLLNVTHVNRFEVDPLTMDGGKPRYYKYNSKNIFVFNNQKYLVTNHWFDSQRRLVAIWHELQVKNQNRNSTSNK